MFVSGSRVRVTWRWKYRPRSAHLANKSSRN